MAVWSSMAYAGTPMSAAHLSASPRVFIGKASRCGKIENFTTLHVRSSGADGHSATWLPIPGCHYHAPGTHSHTDHVGQRRQQVRQPGLPHQWHRYVASPPSTRSASASRTQGTQRSGPMVGRAVSSRTPSDAQPKPERCRNGQRRRVDSRGRPPGRRSPRLRGRAARGVSLRVFLPARTATGTPRRSRRTRRLPLTR